MRLKDVPSYPAYVVFHDAYDNGAMDVYPATSFLIAQERVSLANQELDAMSSEGCGSWKAYEKLPRKRIFKFHPIIPRTEKLVGELSRAQIQRFRIYNLETNSATFEEFPEKRVPEYHPPQGYTIEAVSLYPVLGHVNIYIAKVKK